MSIFTEIEHGDLDSVKALLLEGIDLRIKDRNGCSPLYQAVCLGNLEIVNLLLQASADPNWGGLAGVPIQAAAAQGDFDMVATLIKAGANVDERDEDGRTALMSAAAKNHLAVVQLLIEAGSNANILSKYGDFALLNAAINGHEEVFDYLSRFTSAKLLKQGKKELKQGVIQRQRSSNSSALAFTEAARENKTSVVREMIASGVDINVQNSEGLTAVHLAASEGNIEILQLLIEANANLDIHDDDGRTPLMIAVLSLQLESAQVLLEANVNPNLQDRKGRTALMYAVSFNEKVDILQVLIQHGVDLTITNQRGYTALALALGKKKEDFVDVLRAAGATD